DELAIFRLLFWELGHHSGLFQVFRSETPVRPHAALRRFSSMRAEPQSRCRSRVLTRRDGTSSRRRPSAKAMGGAVFQIHPLSRRVRHAPYTTNVARTWSEAKNPLQAKIVCGVAVQRGQSRNPRCRSR